jgi:hypothetical protein
MASLLGGVQAGQLFDVCIDLSLSVETRYESNDRLKIGYGS